MRALRCEGMRISHLVALTNLQVRRRHSRSMPNSHITRNGSFYRFYNIAAVARVEMANNTSPA